MSKTRRQEQHASIRAEIKAAACHLMELEGTAGISIRGIGRQMDITAPALYHYYASRDALLTDLILDAFNALADALEKARDDSAGLPPAGQLMNMLQVYRTWALAHPIDFQLIYGNPVPGYEAPGETTTPAATRSFIMIGELISAALEMKTLTPRLEYTRIPDELDGFIQVLCNQLVESGANLVPLACYLTAVGWPRIHGVIMLELFNHIQPVVGDVNTFYRIQIEDMFRAMGLGA